MAKRVSQQSSVPSVQVKIPTTGEFLTQWHQWVHGKVAKHFKRDKERIPDAVQRVRLRLLSKDFVARWFFKHLTDDLVDLSQACYMLGGTNVVNIGVLKPVHGKRTDPASLWRISDILAFAKFDYERYFYSVQHHTLDTNKVLRFLGYGTEDDSGKLTVDASDYGVLESLYRQGRMKPSELTEHECTERTVSIPHPDGLCGVGGCTHKHYSRGFCSTHYLKSRVSSCQECERGRQILKQKGISLSDRWTDPKVAKQVARLRWNDSQLTPFLRDWQNSNKVKALPKYIVRNSDVASIDAGLLKYANMVIDNDVINNFKSMSRNEDSENRPESGDSIVWTFDESTGDLDPIFIDESSSYTSKFEDHRDLSSIIQLAGLTDEEMDVIFSADLDERSTKDLAEERKMPISKINKIRASAINKMREIARA